MCCKQTLEITARNHRLGWDVLQPVTMPLSDRVLAPLTDTRDHHLDWDVLQTFAVPLSDRFLVPNRH